MNENYLRNKFRVPFWEWPTDPPEKLPAAIHNRDGHLDNQPNN